MPRTTAGGSVRCVDYPRAEGKALAASRDRLSTLFCSQVIELAQHTRRASAARHAISRRPATPGDDRTRAGEPAQAWFFHPLRARSGCFVIATPLDIARTTPQ